MSVGPFLRITLARLRSERGLTLAELLIGLVTFSFVLFALMSLLDAAVKSAPRDQERANVIREGESGLHRMTRELRQANKVWTPGKTQIYVNIGANKHVLYDCDVAHPKVSTQRRCVRWEAAIGNELPIDQGGQVVVDRRLPGDVFTYSPNLVNPTYVKVHIKVPEAGDRTKDGFKTTLDLNDGFYLRNTDVG
jgi:Tfp pilus assembly protein PilV